MKRATWILILLVVMAACAPSPVQPTQGSADPETAEAATPTTAAPTAANTEPAAPSASPGSVEDTLVGGEVTRALTSEPSTLDPHAPAAAAQNVILPYLLDTLVYRDRDNTYKPFLAERWEISDDGRTITFFLRPGVAFHDGTELNAEAVRFTYERLQQQGQASPLAGAFANVASIEASDDLTVKFTLKSPSSVFLSSLSIPYAGIISPAAVEELGDGFGLQPVGSGPFMLESWQPGEGVTLVRNPDYAWAPPAVENQGAPHLERLVFRIVPDANSQLAAFQSGELDILFINQPAHLDRLAADPQAALTETQLNSLIYLGFNARKAPFDDARVRQALSHAINKEELVQTALGGVGEPAFAPLSPTLPGFDPALKEFELGFDLERAASLLQEAGYTRQEDGSWVDGAGQKLAVELLITTRPPNESLATVVQNQLGQLGVPVAIQPQEVSAATETATAGNYDLMIWRYDWNDADVLNVYLSSDRIGRTNRNFYSNPQVDELLAQAAQELDVEERNRLYFEAQRLILQDAPWQPLYVPKDYVVTRSSIDGVVFGPMGRLLLNDAVVGE